MKKLTVLVVSLLAIGVLFGACGVPQEDLDAAVSARDAVQTKLDSTQTKLNETQMMLDTLEENLGKLVVYGDFVRGHVPSEHGPTCAMGNIYHPGEMVVFRIKIIDPETGNEVPEATSQLMADEVKGDALVDVSKDTKVTVHLSDGQEFPAHFGLHGGLDYFWTYGWEIPADYPTGTINANVTVEWKGKSGEWQPFPIPPSLLTIVE